MTETNKKWERRFNGDGFLWFAETSWHYINPRDFRELAGFLWGFPGAWIGYRKLMLGDKRAGE